MRDLNLLYVEDDKETREAVSILLSDFCNNIYTAVDGVDGLKKFKDNSIDVVLTDIAMPNMDGLDMAKSIKEINKDTDIIVFSAHDESKYLLKAIEIDIHKYLMKPIQVQKLENILLDIAQRRYEKKQLLVYEKELKQMNQNLQQRVEEEIEKNKLQDMILFSQSKTSQMGEMLSMIAHQWRQPLNAISAASINLSLKNDFDMLDKESVKETSIFIQNQTQNMSETINDFMNFFKPEQTQERFTIKDLYKEMDSIISAQIKSRNITIKLIGDEIIIDTYKKELLQVLLNFISNARDAFEDKNIEDKKIKISVNKRDNNIEIIFKDNAGGIDKDKIDRVFDAYFTTKKQGKGTGIGLYMSRRIIQEILQGNVSVRNEDNGAVFTIRIPVNHG